MGLQIGHLGLGLQVHLMCTSLSTSRLVRHHHNPNMTLY